MASRWPSLPISDLTDAIIDYRGKTPTKTASGIPLITAKVVKGGRIETPNEFIAEADFDTWMRRGMPQPGDVLITTEAPLGEVAQLGTERCALAQRLIALRGKRDVLDSRFLKYALLSESVQNELRSRATGTTVLGIKQSELRKVSIPLPSYQEQLLIAKILGELDDKIELNNRMAATLEETARAIFKSWFINFDPVHAKAEGRPTNLPIEIDTLFPDSSEDQADVTMPTGWLRGRLSDVTRFQGGYAFKSRDWVDQGIPVVKIGSVKPGLVDLNSVSYVTEEVASEAARFRLTPGDLLIGMTGYVGEVGLVPITDNPPLLNQRVGKFVQDEPGTSSIAYLYCLTRDADFKAQVESKSHGTAQANVSADGILSVPLIVPPPALRDQFNVLVRPIIDRILDAHAESSTLAITRDILLPNLVSGEIAIRSEGA